MNTTDDVQGPYAADFAVKKLNVRRIAVIHDKSAYGQGVAEEFKKRLEALGGQAIQAERLLRQLRHDRRVVADFLAVNPELPRALRWMQRIKYVRTIVTSLAYWKHLMTMVPRFDVLHVLSASYWSFLLAPAPALAAAKLFRKKAILNYRSGEAADHLGRSSAARIRAGTTPSA